MNKVFTEKQIRELANVARLGASSNFIDDHIKAITKWLEQNQIEPVVVGLSDEQVSELSDFISDDEYRHTSKLRTDVIHESLKTQTFAQPQLKRLLLGAIAKATGEKNETD